MRKSNFFVKYLKNINKSIHSLLEKNLNKLKFENLIGLAKSNKIFLSFVIVIISFLSYLSIPNIYNQIDIADKLKRELSHKFNLEFNFVNKLDYKFFPRPHFVTNESSILYNQNKISEIENIKINISLKNLFSLNNLKIKEVILHKANFNFNKSNYNFFVKILDNNFRNSILKIDGGNIIYRNIENEVLFINKILNMTFLYDDKELKNILSTQNELFNVPYSIKIFDDKQKKKFFYKLNIENLRLQAENQISYSDDTKSGLIYFIFNNLNSIANYNFKKNYFEFNYFEKFKNSKFKYNGKLNFKPFHSILEGKTEQLNLSYLFKNSSIISELLKTEIFNNKNLNFKLNIKANEILNFSSFLDVNLNFKIHEGLIDVDDTSFGWKSYTGFKLSNTLIYVKNGELFLDGTSKINLSNYNEIYKFLVTPKNYRKKINKVDVNFTYNFDKKTIMLKDVKIDGKINENVNKIFSNISIKNNDLQNKIYFKNLLNEAIKSYAG